MVISRTKSKQSAQDISVRDRRIVVGVMVVILVAAWLVYVFFFVQRDRFEVTGVVLRDGRPIDLKECRIVFTNLKTKRIGVGIFDEQGRYRIHTYKDSGLPPGEYEAVISFPAGYLLPRKSETQAYPMVELEKILAKSIPRKYRDPETSGLVLTITDHDVELNVDMTD